MNFRRILSIILILVMVSAFFVSTSTASTVGTTYYISYSAGDDSYNGTSISTPWKTFAKANTITFQPGDQILLKCGDTWSGVTFFPMGNGTSENPIIISSYGTGDRPILSGSEATNVWGIKLIGLSGYKITNLEFGNIPIGIHWWADNTAGHDYLWIENCYFHDCETASYGNAPFPYPGVYNGCGIAITGKDTIGGRRQLSNITVKDCSFYRTDVGLFTNGFSNNEDSNYQTENLITANQLGNLNVYNCTFTQIYRTSSIYLADITGGGVYDCVVDQTGYQKGVSYGTAGVQFIALSNFEMLRTEIKNTRADNNSPDGAGIDFEAQNQNVTVKDCNIHDNLSVGFMNFSGNPDEPGGNTNIVVDNCTLKNNNSRNYQGNIAYWVTDASVGGTIKNCSIYLQNDSQTYDSGNMTFESSNKVWNASGQLVFGGDTATPTTQAGIMGCTTIGSSTDTNGNGDMVASRFIASSDFVATQMKVYLDAAVTGKVKCAIYSDSNGTPGSKLAETVELTDPGAGWQTLTGLNISIVNGTKYWLAVWGNTSNTIKCESAGGTIKACNSAYGEWPSTFPAVTGTASLKYSIYAQGTNVETPVGESTLKAGVAKVIITPEENSYLSGYSYDPDTRVLCSPPSDVLDDTYARILVLEDSATGKRTLFISGDACMYTESPFWDDYDGVWIEPTVPAGTRQRFADAAGADLDSTFFIATHTHQASHKLMEKYIQRMCEGITSAASNLRTVNVGYQVSTDEIGAYRRPDFICNPGHAADKQVTGVRLTNASDNQTMAVIVNYPIHNTAIGNGHQDMWNKSSTELTGFAMNYLESAYDNGAVALFFQGMSGDMGPNIGGAPSGSYSTVKTYGQDFGARLKTLLDGTVQNPVTTLSAIQSTVNVPTKSGWGVPSENVVFSAARIGDIALVGVSGEPFQDLGAYIKANSPAPVTLTCGLTNEYRGYFPSSAGYNEIQNDSEVTSKCPYNPATIGQVVTSNTISLLDSLWGREPQTPVDSANYAAGKSITSSSTNLINPERVTDGVKEGDSVCDVGSTKGAQWIQIDLGASYDINKINLWHYFGDARTYHDVIVQVSNDSSFAEKTTVFNNDADNSAGQGIGSDAEYVEVSSGKIISFSPVNARYVRLWTYGSNVNTYNHYLEVEVYNTDETTPAPVHAGLDTVGSSTEATGANYLVVCKTTASQDISVKNLNLYVDSNATGKARLGIYSDNAGTPGTLLAQTEEITLVNGWNSGSITSVNLVSGKQYWLAFNLSQTGSVLRYNPQSGVQKYIPYPYASLPVSPSETIMGGALYSIYAGN